MYNFVFWFFYKFYEWRSRERSAWLAAMPVGIAIIMHIGLIHSIARYFTGFRIGVFSEQYGLNKLLMFPFILVGFFLLWLYFKNKVERIMERYSNTKFSNFKNILYILLVMVVPLLIAIWLTNLSVTKWAR